MWDKSEQDRLSKVIASLQIAYIIIQCIGRATQNLAITTLELNKLDIVVCSLCTAYAWQHKQFDVLTPIPSKARTPLRQITGDRPWRNTKLEFVDENGPSWAMNVQPFVKLSVISLERPLQSIPNDHVPMNPYGMQEYFLGFATLLFGGIHVAGWNFSFPTKTERNLWHCSSLVLFGVTAAFWVLEAMASWRRLERWKWIYL